MHRTLTFSLVLLMLVSTGCERDSLTKHVGYSRARMLRMMVSEDEETLARRYVENIRLRQFDPVLSDLDPSINRDEAATNLERISAFFPQRNPASQKLVIANVIHHPDSSTTSNLVFEYEFAPDVSAISETDSPQSTWVLASVVVKSSENKRVLEGITFTPIARPLEEINAFTLVGKGASQYLVLLLSLPIMGVVVYALAKCVRTEGVKRRWLWAIAILIGVGQLTVNWTTGESFVRPIAIHLVPGAIFCAPYGPWIFTVSFPVGAMAFLIHRRKLLMREKEQELNAAPHSAG